MITKYDFIRDINKDNPTRDIPQHMPEMAVLYYLVGVRSDVDIYTTSETDGSFGFSISTDEEGKAKSLKEQLNGAHFCCYGSTFHLNARTHKTKVNVTMRQEGS